MVKIDELKDEIIILQKKVNELVKIINGHSENFNIIKNVFKTWKDGDK